MTREKSIQLYELLKEYCDELTEEMKERSHGANDKTRQEYYVTHMIAKEIKACILLNDSISFDL